MPSSLTDGERRRLQNLIEQTSGPAPWYWKQFPSLHSEKRYEWTYHGDQGMLAYLVTLNETGKPNEPLLALNTYCTPFELPGGKLGIWCPEGRSMMRVAAFDPGQLKPFHFEELVGWFKNSADKMYSAIEPIADFEFSAELPEGTHEVQVPAEFQGMEELGMIGARRAISNGDPACAVFVLYPHAGLVQVLPQTWFISGEYEVGKQWITRIARDPVSHRLIGDGFRIPAFQLTEDGKQVENWIS